MKYYFAYFSDIESTYKLLKTSWDSYSHSSSQAPLSTNLESIDDHSPSLSISDLYDSDARPITIPASTATKRSNSVVANALAIKDFLYPSTSTSTKSIKSSQSIPQEDLSSSTDEEDSSIGWLDGKRRSGMRLVYGLLGGNATTTMDASSTAMYYQEYGDDDDEEEEDDEDIAGRSFIPSSREDGAEVLDDRTMTNFQKYFVLPESEELLTGK